ncbi:MAG: type pilus modification protein PilV [Gammaproteobacteria bacterium]|jgi:type IV pilus assembly protein PilV|nr:type pilus modification protein PilV [Gammaproteobacteria bacterium]
MLTARQVPALRRATVRLQRGTSLIEVLVTLLILAFGLLGVAGLQSKMGVAEMESYQRSQALVVLSDMAERISANRDQAASYVTTGPLGTGDAEPVACTGIAVGPDRDLCEWSNALKGAAEQKLAANVGGMIGARGCVTEIRASNPATGVCAPGIYQVAVAWQGTNRTVASTLVCGRGQYGADDSYRRVLATTVSIPTTSCQLH